METKEGTITITLERTTIAEIERATSAIECAVDEMQRASQELEKASELLAKLLQGSLKVV